MVSGHRKKRIRYLGFALGILGSAVAGYYFLNLAIFNAWLSAFEKHQDYLGTLKIRFWIFGSLFVVFLGLTIFLIVKWVKSINREHKTNQRGKAQSKNVGRQ